MKKAKAFVFIIILDAILMVSAQSLAIEKKKGGPCESKTIRAAVIGGMTMTGMWQNVTKIFEAKTGYRVVVVETGPRPAISQAFRKGKADILTMHSGDITTDLVADGYGTRMRPWTHNNLVILGPISDPAGIKGMKDGAEAFRIIAEKKAKFVDLLGIGKREVCHRLWQRAGIEPKGGWVLKDEADSHRDILSYVRKQNATVCSVGSRYCLKKWNLKAWS
jgi:tungstate transport system substrate-binding protein